MSNAIGTIRFTDGKELFGVYTGSCDVMLEPLFPSAKEAWDTFWEGRFPSQIDCQCVPEPCLVHSGYGGGFWWVGRACRSCMVLIGPRAPFDEEGVERTDGPLPS